MTAPTSITTCCWVHPERESSADFPAVCDACQAEAWQWARQLGLDGNGGWLYLWLRDMKHIVAQEVSA
jgi:hypothetical protein